jgi:hypothetical protein
MARTRFLVAALAIAGFAALAAPVALAAPGGGESEAARLEEHAKALRQKAEALRAKGSTEDADHVEQKAAAIEAQIPDARARDEERARLKEKVEELRERAAKAKAEGRKDDARAAWQEAEDLMRAHREKHGGGGGGGKEDELRRHAGEIREKARLMREKGSVEDAEHLEEKANRIDRALELRRESNELERRGKEAKEAGNGDEARELMEKSGHLWRESDALLGGRPPERKPGGDARGVLKGTPEESRRRITALRDAARVLRENDLPDRAEALENQAAEAEKALEGRAGEGDRGDVDAIRAELERVRRRAAELEEELRRRER